MAEVKTTRSDADIENDIDRIITHYPPLVQDRHFITVAVHDGAVTISGYVRTSITGDHLISAVRALPDVVSLDQRKFYGDDRIRLEVGQQIPAGIATHVEHGAVILTGHLPAEYTEKKLIAAVSKVAGVRAVQAKFS